MKNLITVFFFSILVSNSFAQTWMAGGRTHLAPLPSLTAGTPTPVYNLNGTWEVNMLAGETFSYDVKSGTNWKPILVPGEPSMQGFAVKNDVPFAYRKKINIPVAAAGKKQLIRFNGVYSYAKVYFNGQFVREHYGGFTAWDCDITSFIKPGQDNWLHVVVTDRADDISYASGYAHHPIGGILRNVQYIVLPQIHLQRLYANATLENNYQTGKLTLDLSLNQPAKATTVEWTLSDPSGKYVRSRSRTVRLDQNGNAKDEIEIAAVKSWTAETPHLYTLKVNVLQQGKLQQSVEQMIGFRKVEIDSEKRLLVNGHSVKLRGACRHDMHPLLGRSTNREQDSLDVVLAKEANLNFIRTSHYPPTQDFLEFCDRYGIYVQEETAICFVLDWREGIYLQYYKTQDDPAFTDRYLGQLSEMIDRDRNHAAVVMWSIGNESWYGSNFQKEYDFVKSVDMSRPVSWSFPTTALDKGKRCFDILVSHYPKYDGNINTTGQTSDLGKYEKNMKADYPIIGDEWAHVSCYNTDMLTYDPNIKDFWGKSLDSMWMYRFDVDGYLGGAIWGMIDETFHLKDTVTGYGPWGFIDVWRRKKPEFWNTKKAYSPIRVILANAVDKKNGTMELPVKNRFDHLNLSEVKAYAVVNGKSTALQLPSVAAHKEGVITIPYNGKELLLQFRDADGMLIDEELIGAKEPVVKKPEKKGEWIIMQDEKMTVLINGTLQVKVDHKKGMIAEAILNGQAVLTGGPLFTVNRPKNPNVLKITGEIYSGAYIADSFYIQQNNKEAFVFFTKGKVDEYPVSLITTLYPNGVIETNYTADSIPAQTWEIGLQYPVANSLDQIEWNRKGYWSTYPAAHLSPLTGKAQKKPVIEETYRVKPLYAVENGFYDYYLTGANNAQLADMGASEIYRAKKENIYHFSVYNATSPKEKIQVIADGKQAAKMAVKKDGTQSLIVADKWDYWGLSWGNFAGTRNKSKQFSGTITIKIGE